MASLFDPFREDMARIKCELEKLQGCKIHVGIMGDAGSRILTIAGVHEYGATIRPSQAKNLAIPLDKEAKGKSPSAFNDLEWIPGHDPGVSFLARKKKHRAKNKKSEGLSPSSDYNPDDYTWMYMLVKSVTIPERSFIRGSYDNGKDTLENLCKEAIDGIISSRWTAEMAVNHIGSKAVEMTRQYMNKSIPPPKSDITMRTTNQHQTLYDSGDLVGSIWFDLEWGSGS